MIDNLKRAKCWNAADLILRQDCQALSLGVRLGTWPKLNGTYLRRPLAVRRGDERAWVGFDLCVSATLLGRAMENYRADKPVGRHPDRKSVV